MGGIQFDPNAGGAQGPRETIAGHTFNAGQSAAINECKGKIESLVKERNNASEHMPEQAFRVNDELEQFMNTGVQGKLKEAGLNSKEIKDVTQHLKETTGYKELPANLSKMDSGPFGKISMPPEYNLLNSREKEAVNKLADQIKEEFSLVYNELEQLPKGDRAAAYDGKKQSIESMFSTNYIGKTLKDMGGHYGPRELDLVTKCLEPVMDTCDETVINYLNSKTTHMELSASSSKIDSAASKKNEPVQPIYYLSVEKRASVVKLMGDLTDKLTDLMDKMKNCRTQQEKKDVYNEAMSTIRPMMEPGQVKQMLKGQDFSPDELKIAVDCLRQRFDSFDQEIKRRYGV
jgi:hypothetical protein